MCRLPFLAFNTSYHVSGIGDPVVIRTAVAQVRSQRERDTSQRENLHGGFQGRVRHEQFNSAW